MEGKRIVIRTFGYFDIFVDGETIPFSCKKAKELLALLVDRRGGFVTTGDAISYLWEDECTEKRIKDKFRKVVKELRRTLNAYGIERVLHRVNQESRIQAGFAHGWLKAAAQRCERKIRVLHPLGSGLLQ